MGALDSALHFAVQVLRNAGEVRDTIPDFSW